MLPSGKSVGSSTTTPRPARTEWPSIRLFVSPPKQTCSRRDARQREARLGSENQVRRAAPHEAVADLELIQRARSTSGRNGRRTGRSRSPTRRLTAYYRAEACFQRSAGNESERKGPALPTPDGSTESDCGTLLRKKRTSHGHMMSFQGERDSANRHSVTCALQPTLNE